MTDPSELTNDALLQELRHRVQSGFITMRVESMMAGRGVRMSLSTTNSAYGTFSFGVEDLRKWVADRVL
jgi:hypothetical protein